MENIFIGIDVSKQTVDLSVYTNEHYQSFQLKNTKITLNAFFKKFNKQSISICMENTGRYNFILYDVLKKFDYDVYVVHPMHIKNSIGFTRGKSDKIDAKRICLFIQKNHTELDKWTPNTKEVEEFKILLSERNNLIKHITRLKQQNKSMALCSTKRTRATIKRKKNQIEQTQKEVKFIENMLNDIVNSHQELKQNLKRITSIPGVGKVTAWTLIAKTNGFTRLLNPRKLGCFCGVVPFDQQSGTSIKTKPRVSKMADKELKTVLQMCAMRTVRMQNSSLRKYYLRKVEQGKNKMLVLNNIRNKIIHLVLALIKNKSFYKFDLQLS